MLGPATAHISRLGLMIDARCVFCSMKGRAPTKPASNCTPGVVAYLDDQLLYLFGSGVEGMVLAPRLHGGVMPTEVGASGTLLSALRIAVTDVQSAYGVSGATIEAIIDLPGAAGHVCYHVRPTPWAGGTSTLPSRLGRGAGRLTPVLSARMSQAKKRPATDVPQFPSLLRARSHTADQGH